MFTKGNRSVEIEVDLLLLLQVCDRCGSEQSYDEWRGKKTTCSACEVGKFVVRSFIIIVRPRRFELGKLWSVVNLVLFGYKLAQIRKAVRDKVCFICGERQIIPTKKYCSKHPNERFVFQRGTLAALLVVAHSTSSHTL